MNIEFKKRLENIETFNQFIDFLADSYQDKTAISQLKDQEFEIRSFNDLKMKAENFAKFLIAKGFTKESKIVLLSESRIEYPEIAFGTLLAGVVLVPLDVKLTEYELSNLISHCEPQMIIYSSLLESQLLKAKQLTNHSIPVLLIDKMNVPEFHHIKIPPVDGNRMNILVYTSGTAGAPKGVMTKLSSILFETKNAAPLLYTNKSEAFLSMLPLNHLFEFTSGLCTTLLVGAEVCMANSIEKEHLMECMRRRKITQMVTVPLFLTNLKKGIERNVNEGPVVKKFLFNSLLFICQFIKSHQLRRTLFASLHEKMGGQLYRMIIGSAAVPKEVINFFNLVGINVYEGYGLSETGPIISTNSIEKYRIGSVGTPLNGIEVKIKDGEVLTRGNHLMMGYYKNPTLTQEVFDENGWFKTGDIGEIDKDGFIFIIGRKKKLIVFEGGKKVHPEEVECLLANDHHIKEVAVLGRKSYVGAVNDTSIVAALVPSDELAIKYCDNWDQLEKIMINKVKEITKMLAEFKRPTEFIIFKEELSKTTTKKIKLQEISDLVHNHFKNNQVKNIPVIAH